nr:extensin-like [Lolium perenne]
MSSSQPTAATAAASETPAASSAAAHCRRPPRATRRPGGCRRRRPPPLASRAFDGHPRPRHHRPGHPLCTSSGTQGMTTPPCRHLLPPTRPRRQPFTGRGAPRSTPGLTRRRRGLPAAGPQPRAPASLPRGVPIRRVRFPPSPSRLPAWVTATEPPPVYSAAPAPSPVYTTAGDPPRPSFPDPPPLASPRSAAGRAEYPAQGATGLAPPRYAKLEFATYDGVEDPLNWLNQCEQFFRG